MSKKRRNQNSKSNQNEQNRKNEQIEQNEQNKTQETVVKEAEIKEIKINEPDFKEQKAYEQDLEEQKAAEQDIEEQEATEQDTEMDVPVKKERKRVSLTIPGIILYSVLLIAVMFGVFWGTKSLLNRVPQAPVKETATPAPSEEAVSEETEAAVQPTEAPAEEEEVEDWIDVSKILSSDQVIDYTTLFYEPNKRNVKLTWKDTVFSKLENPADPELATIHSYQLSRKWATRDDGKKMEFEIYSDPVTGMTEKITAIEHCGDYLEILDYYYDQGKINYIAQHQMIVNTPVDITSADIVGRYYFNNDTLVKFSAVENATAYEYQVSKLNDYSNGAIKQYDYLEDTMINWAYVTYKVVQALPETEYIEGYVFDVYNSAMADVDVTLVAASTGEAVMTTKTNGDGLYSFNAPVNNKESYTIQMRKQGLDNLDVYGIGAASGASSYYVKPAFMSYPQDGAVYSVQISLRDASEKGKGLDSAILNIRKGLDNQTGEIYVMGTADGTGLSIVSLPAGTYTGEITKSGYETSYFPIVVEMTQTSAYGYTVPDLADGEYRFVSSWNTPSLDLESLLFVNSSNETARSSIDSTDNTAAEIISLNQPETGIYRFFMYDYTSCTGNNGMSYAMSTANTLVTVFGPDGYMGSYSAPIGHGGVIWNVCNLQNGRLTSIGDYYTVFQPDSYWITK